MLKSVSSSDKSSVWVSVCLCGGEWERERERGPGSFLFVCFDKTFSRLRHDPPSRKWIASHGQSRRWGRRRLRDYECKASLCLATVPQTLATPSAFSHTQHGSELWASPHLLQLLFHRRKTTSLDTLAPNHRKKKKENGQTHTPIHPRTTSPARSAQTLRLAAVAKKKTCRRELFSVCMYIEQLDQPEPFHGGRWQSDPGENHWWCKSFPPLCI